MAFNAGYWGALQLVSQIFLLGLPLLSPQGVKASWGTQLWWHPVGSVGLCPSHAAEPRYIYADGWIIILSQWAFLILLISLAICYLTDQIIHTHQNQINLKINLRASVLGLVKEYRQIFLKERISVYCSFSPSQV